MSARLTRLAIGAALITASCASVLGLRDGLRERGFPHRAHVFQGVGCFQCHAGLATARTSTGGFALHLPDDASCLACHQTPHDRRPCLDCHAERGARARLVEASQHLRFDHARHLPTVNMNCGRCHLGVPEDRPEPPTMAGCLSCHGHDDAYRARECQQCHLSLADERLRPLSHAVHDRDFVGRHGAFAGSQRDYCATCHAERDCLACHGVNVPALPARLALGAVGPGSTNLHRAGFRARHADEARADGGACARCHAPSTCQDCHLREGVGAVGSNTRGPHPANWVGPRSTDNTHGRAARLDPVSCAGCHDGAGEALCASCHQVGGIGGNVHPPGWKSAKRISERPCRLCHTGVTP